MLIESLMNYTKVQFQIANSFVIVATTLLVLIQHICFVGQTATIK